MKLKSIKLQNGEELGYREGGTDNNPLILLIHGNLVSSRHWGGILDILAKDYHIVALDLRGAGISSYNTPISTFQDWAYDMKLFCDELKLKDFLLLGWSMGGGISQQFVVGYPDYAKQLLLLEAVPCSGYSYHKKDADGNFLPDVYDKKEELLEDKVQLKPMVDALEKNNRAYMKYLWDQLVFSLEKPGDEEYTQLIDDIYLTRNLRDAAWAAHIFNISSINNGVVQGTNQAKDINIPVAVLAGDSDLIVPMYMNEFTVKEIGSNAKLEILPNCGHCPHYDNIDLVVEKIKEFYK